MSNVELVRRLGEPSTERKLLGFEGASIFSGAGILRYYRNFAKSLSIRIDFFDHIHNPGFAGLARMRHNPLRRLRGTG